MRRSLEECWIGDPSLLARFLCVTSIVGRDREEHPVVAMTAAHVAAKTTFLGVVVSSSIQIASSVLDQQVQQFAWRSI